MLHTIFSFCLFTMVLSSAFSSSLFGTTATSHLQLAGTKEFPLTVLQAASTASQNWLNIVDSNRYGESWDKLSSLSKLSVKKEEWVEILEKTRRPLGAATSREVVDERTAKDPSGMPKGDYIVMLYKTQFSRQTVFELVTLYLEDGQWLVSTYQVDTH